MKKYIGTKQIKAIPMILGEFVQTIGRNPYGKDIENHEETESGYLVEYEDGYKSWLPKEVFERVYKCAETFLDRLVIERRDLAEKLEKLCLFIDSPRFVEVIKDENQRELLIKQRNYMNEYLNILNQRIKTLE